LVEGKYLLYKVPIPNELTEYRQIQINIISEYKPKSSSPLLLMRNGAINRPWPITIK
tara:strand:+ start:155 stop:325 length:171 start_codon:yes stop_codon:yes gene_type:complete